ncbi:nucleotidyltransferase domain-containing protein [Sedimenticola hydrogenitrophicus]|uniref:nucleotidyltransferase domain-containing protein n=1 Tax=Sedimenticola hydrogenitrophicus TaxID=2967975 RepID=UPI002FF5E208
MTTNIGDALFTKTQQRVLGLLFGRPQQSFYLNELVRMAGVGKGSVMRELEKLRAAGLLTVTRIGNQNHYQANAENPIFAELKGIAQKSFGLVDIVGSALRPLLDEIELALIYGSMAKGAEHAGSDIDLLLVSDSLSYGAVMEVLVEAETQLGRTINPTLYTPREFAERKRKQQHFITRLMGQQVLWIKRNPIWDDK